MSLLKVYDNALSFPRSFGLMNDRLFDRFFDDVMGATQLSNFNPTVDVVEDANNYYLKVAAPGMKKEDFKVEVHDNRLFISGERKMESKEEGEKNGRKYHFVETSYGQFSRAFRLPQNVAEGNVKATYVDGILEISLAKQEEAKKPATRVEIS